jgi:hypothetical protein
VGEQQRAGDEGARYATCGRACTFHWPLLLCLWEREKCSLIWRGMFAYFMECPFHWVRKGAGFSKK